MAGPHLPVVPIQSSLNEDGSRNFVYTADVHGRFHTARNWVFALLIAIYVGLPWIKIGGHPAVSLDIVTRSFFLFGFTFNAQDLPLTFFFVSGVVFLLLFATAMAGRVWCGWGCPQTVFLDGIYRRIERWIEGPRYERMRRAQGPMTFERIARAVATHLLYALVSVLVAHVLMSYFVSLPRLFAMVRAAPTSHPAVFTIVFVASGLLYANFAWFREQLCIGVCPYGRLQAALTDADSLGIGYDARRGEPRGKVKDTHRGHCVDCNRCVVVCPTGIDIRNGTQLDCIGCTACIDACDEIMDKLHQPRGLIRYDSENGLRGEKRRFWRPRIAVYIVLGILGVIATGMAMRSRHVVDAALHRIAGEPYVVEEGVVRNAFELHLVNKGRDAVDVEIDPEAHAGVEWTIPLQHVRLESLSSTDVPLFASVPLDRFHGEFTVQVSVHRNHGDHEPLVVSARFLGPER